LVQAEIDGGLPSDKVVVAGFSQGGAIAVQMLRSDKKFAGIVGERKRDCIEGGSRR
jgi:predicted esterase